MSNPSTPAAAPRRASILAALLFGVPLAAGVVCLIRFGPLRDTVAARYVQHEIQWAVVCFFCTAMSALVMKWLRLRVEFDAFERNLLPRWDGKVVEVEKAGDLLAALGKQPAGVMGTYLGRRLRAVLDFLVQRRSTQQYDDQLRCLADADAAAQENSFGLIKFLIWALPILGFLGTVLGITAAISSISPESLQDNIGELTGGLAEAFDSTALGLGLTMLAMFLTYTIERREQALVEEVDRYIDGNLAHRFRADHPHTGAADEVVQHSTAALTRAVETLVERQAELWAGALDLPQRRANETYQQMTEQFVLGLGEAMRRSLEMHEERLRMLEQQSVQGSTQLMQQLAGLAVAVRDTGREQQQALARVAEGIVTQAGVLAKIQEDENNLVHLQAVLHQNLAALASASSFEDAVHSLTAAVHLLTNRAGGQQQPTALPFPRRAA